MREHLCVGPAGGNEPSQPTARARRCIALTAALLTLACSLRVELVRPLPVKSRLTVQVAKRGEGAKALLGEQARVCFAQVAPPGAYPPWGQAEPADSVGQFSMPESKFDLTVYDCADPPEVVFWRRGVDGSTHQILALDDHDFLVARAESVQSGRVGDPSALDRLTRTEELLNAALALRPSPRAHINLAYVAAGASDGAAELRAWEKAIELVGDRDTTYDLGDANGYRRSWLLSQYAHSLRLVGKQAEAATAYGVALDSWRSHPERERLHVWDVLERGMARHFTGDRAGAALDFNQVIESQDAFANQRLFDFSFAVSRDLATAQRAMLRSPLHASLSAPYQVLLLRALAMRTGDPTVARAELERLADCEPRVVGANLERAQCSWYLPRGDGGVALGLERSALAPRDRLRDRYLTAMATLYLDPTRVPLRASLLETLNGHLGLASAIHFYLAVLDWAQHKDVAAATGMSKVIELSQDGQAEFWLARELILQLPAPKD